MLRVGSSSSTTSGGGGNITSPAPPRIFAGLDLRRAKRGTPVAAAQGKSFSTKEAYPMWVLELKAALELERFKPHQELLRDGALVKYNHMMHGRVLFVSHQWLGWSEPDPDGEAWRALRTTLRRLASGEAGDVEATSMQQLLFKDRTKVTAAEWQAALPAAYLWIDFCSMPQPGAERAGDDERLPGTADHRHEESQVAKDLANAVSSIPSYVERSTLVMVLASPATHADTVEACDYKAWRGRGWCRMEFVAALLATETKRVLVTKGPEFTPELLQPADCYFLLAGEGEYTCCARKHDFGHGVVPCDKLKVRAVLEQMLGTKVAHLRAAGQWLEAQYYVAMRHWFLRGLGDADGGSGGGGSAWEVVSGGGATDVEEGSSAVEALKERLGWRDETTDAAWVAATGTGLLFWGAMADDLGAVRALLRAGEDANAGGLKVEVPKLSLSCGLRPLHAAMAFASWAVVAALLDGGADPEARDAKGFDAVMHASLMGRTDNLRAWLGRFPQWDLNGRRDRTPFRAVVLNWCAVSGPSKASAVRILLGAKADPRVRENGGQTALHNAVGNRDADPARCMPAVSVQRMQ